MDSSPLGRLPVELRIEIYQLALALPGDISFGLDMDTPPVTLIPITNTLTHVLAITRTCKEIRNETAGLFVASNALAIRIKSTEAVKDTNSNSIITPWWPGFIGSAPALNTVIALVRPVNVAKTPSITLHLSRMDIVGYVKKHKGPVLRAAQELNRLSRLYPAWRVHLRFPTSPPTTASGLQSLDELAE